MKKYRETWFYRVFNDLSIRKKLIILYAVCSMIPLCLMNQLFLHLLIQGEQREQYKNMENTAEKIETNVNRLVSEAELATNRICANREICMFLDKQYSSGLAFFTKRQKLFSNTFFDEGFVSAHSRLTIFADNLTIINGGFIRQLNKSDIWYQQWENNNKKDTLCIYYTGNGSYDISVNQRMVSFVREMKLYPGITMEKLVRVDFRYSYLVELFREISNNQPVSICSGGRVIFSNQEESGFYTDFDKVQRELPFAYLHEFEVCGTKIQTIFWDSGESFVLTTVQKKPKILFALLAVSFILPFILLYFIDRSITGRLRKLGNAFRRAEEKGELVEVEYAERKDEIGYLMAGYNHLVQENNHLVKTVYEHRLHKQEMEIEKQNAELLALRMQVNPHFLFNMLESIRMSSLLNHESRTAEMIEKLAILERQAVDWDSDFETIRNEISFVDNYLSLQQFRFGDRFFYQLDVEEDCMELRIPKMSILTFVENACVHGTNKKLTQTRVFVTISKRNEETVEIEIEDTSGGMKEEKLQRLREQIENCTMDMLRESKHTGVINACLRLKMMSGNQVKFELESEEGVGTYLVILLPIETMKKERKAW